MYFAWLGCEDTGSCIALVVVMGIAGGSFVTLQPPLAVMTAKDMRYGGTMVGQALCECHLTKYPNINIQVSNFQVSKYSSTSTCILRFKEHLQSAIDIPVEKFHTDPHLSRHVPRPTSFRTLLRRTHRYRHHRRQILFFPSCDRLVGGIVMYRSDVLYCRSIIPRKEILGEGVMIFFQNEEKSEE